jgi:hypothetical protein
MELEYYQDWAGLPVQLEGMGQHTLSGPGGPKGRLVPVGWRIRVRVPRGFPDLARAYTDPRDGTCKEKMVRVEVRVNLTRKFSTTTTECPSRYRQSDGVASR